MDQTTSLDRLGKNLTSLRERVGKSSSEHLQNSEQVTREIIEDSARIAASSQIPEQQAVNNFTQAYREASKTQQTTNR